MKRITQLLLPIFLLTMLFSCEEEEKAPIGGNKITIGTTTGSTILYTTATVTSAVESIKGNKVIEHGHYWGIEANPVVEGNKTKLGNLNDVKTFTSQLDKLSANTTYYIRPYIITEYETIYGDETTIKTIDYAKPTVAATIVTGVTPFQATSGGNVTSDGGLPVTARGVVWNTTGEPSITHNIGMTTDGNGTESFISQLTNLQPGTTYYVKAYATNSNDTDYGEQVIFTTKNITTPEVTTANVAGIFTTSAVCGGNVTSDGYQAVTSRGVVWSTTSEPTITDKTGITIDAGNGIGSFNSQLTYLQPNTTYFVRAYATNEKGTTYGSTVSFKTTNETDSQSINGYTLTQNETWSGTILLKGDIVVPSGITLTINPGTIINISTDAPLYDGSYNNGKIELYIKGNLIINGIAQNIVRLKSTAILPKNDDWQGIIMWGDRLNITYCYISDSYYGIFHATSSPTAMKIKNCLFTNIISAIVDFGSVPHTLSYNSFINVANGYSMWDSNRNTQLDYSEFRNNTSDISVSGTSNHMTNNSSISVNYSNFSGNKWYNLYWSPDGNVTNSNITANYCSGITTYQTNDNGNTYTSKNPLSAPSPGAGCGFSSMLKSASLRSYTIGNLEQEKRIMQEHNEEIKRIYEELNRQ